MGRIIDKDLQNLKNFLISLFEKVEEMVRGSILAIKTCDLDLARQVVKSDDAVDSLASHIFEYVNSVIALKQPTAKDLRLLTSAINLAKDLERIADQSVNLAEIIPTLSEEKERLNYLNAELGKAMDEMEREAWDMLSSAVNAFMTADLNLASRVILRDSQVDHLYKRIENVLLKVSGDNPSLFKSAMVFSKITENLERIADLSTNICEEVFFINKGERVRLAQLSPPEVERKDLRIISPTLVQLFENLQKHIVLVVEALQRVPLALDAAKNDRWEIFQEVKRDILEIEEKADQVKRSIRGHLPKGLILPVDKFEIFQYLKEADSLADFAEEFLLLLDLRLFKIPESLFRGSFSQIDFALSQAVKLPEILELCTAYLTVGDEASREKAKDLIRDIRRNKNDFVRSFYVLKQELYQMEKIVSPFQAIYYSDLEEKIRGLVERIENSADLLRAMIAKV